MNRSVSDIAVLVAVVMQLLLLLVVIADGGSGIRPIIDAPLPQSQDFDARRFATVEIPAGVSALSELDRYCLATVNRNSLARLNPGIDLSNSWQPKSGEDHRRAVRAFLGDQACGMRR